MELDFYNIVRIVRVAAEFIAKLIIGALVIIYLTLNEIDQHLKKIYIFGEKL